MSRTSPPVTVTPESPGPASAGPGGTRRFGPFLLRQLAGRSSRAMTWLAHDTRNGQDVHLMLPRQPLSAAQQANSLEQARRAARLEHPRLAPLLEVGQLGGRTYLVAERARGMVTLAEWPGVAAPLEVATWGIDLLDGLAYAHDAGCVHGDLGPHSLLIDRNGRLASWGHGVTPVAGTALSDARDAVDRDLALTGLLLHLWLARAPALGESDLPTAVERLRAEIVRLPWALPQPVPDALRAIVNRATDRHAHRRYVGARSLQRALEGWRRVEADGRHGPLALMVERLASAGHLPALPGLPRRVKAVVRMERQPLYDLTAVITEDPALSFELLRQVNAARHAHRDEGPVTTVRRSVHLLGLSGLRRAASALRPWPGPLDERSARALYAGLRHARLAGQLAWVLAPGGLDAEACLLVAQLQQLGWLLALYHFPEEARQITQLMQPVPAAVDAAAQTPGLDPGAAAMAVLGTDLTSLAHAVARHWGLGAAMVEMMQPLDTGQAVQTPVHAQGWTRLVASCANESLAAASLPAEQAKRRLQRVAGRYARALGTTPETLKAALVDARARLDRDPRAADAVRATPEMAP